MSRETTLNWNSLSDEQLGQVEEALSQWETNQQTGSTQEIADFCADASLLPFVEQRIREQKGLATQVAPHENRVRKNTPLQIGPIRITEVIANKSLCDVYRGEQADPKREVAIKVLHLNAGGQAIERAFRNEIEILARLRHPGIAEVYLAGTSDNDGNPLLYFAMEYLNGPKLTEHADSQRLSTRDRVELFRQVCLAVAHAHQNAVIHRDLKPTNILTHDGQPKILDFGISKLVRETGTVQTNFGMGTPGYISPEQFSGESAQDTRSDIFSLGVTLYELLTGELPYDRPVKNLVDAAKAIADDNFVALSKRVERCPRDLEAITHKCLQLKPEDRYQSVFLLVDDLQRYLANQEVRARPHSRLEVARHWSYRNPGVTAGLISSTVCLILVTILSLIYWKNAVDAAASLAALRKSDQASRAELEDELSVRRRSAFNQILANADRSWERSPGIVDSWLDDASDSGLVQDNFAWRVMKHRVKRVINEFKAHDSPVTQLSVSTDGSRLASASNGVIKIWSIDDNRQLLSKSIEPLHVRSLSLHPAGEQLIFQDRNVLTLLDCNNGEVLRTLPTHSHSRWLTGFSRDGNFVFSAGTSNQISVLTNDLISSVQSVTAPFGKIAYAKFSPDSTKLLAISPRREYAVWDIKSGDLEFQGSAKRRSVKAYSATEDFSSIATAEQFTNLFVMSANSEAVETILSRGERFDHLQFSPDQQWLLSIGRSQINGRSRETGWKTQWTTMHDESPTSVQFLPESDAYLVGMEDGRIQTCLVEAEPLDRILAEGIVDPRAISLSADGRQIVVSGKDIAVYATASGKCARRFQAQGLCVDSDWNSDALYIATSKQRELLCFKDLSSDPFAAQVTQHSIRSVATGREHVYLGLAYGEIWQFAAQESSQIFKWDAHESTVTALAYIPERAILLSGSERGEVAMWDRELRLVSRFQLHAGAVTEFAFVNSKDRIYCSSRDGSVGVIDTDHMVAQRPLNFGIGRLRTLAVSPDGQSLAIASTDNEILICDAETGEFQTRLSGHEDFVMDLCFSHNGDSLYSVSLDGTLRCWHPKSR